MTLTPPSGPPGHHGLKPSMPHGHHEPPHVGPPPHEQHVPPHFGPPPHEHHIPPHFGPPLHVHIVPPLFPPPIFIPTFPVFIVNPSSISNCLFRNTYVWLTNGNQFWFFPTDVGFATVTGFWWTGSVWLIIVLSLNEIQSFSCF